MENKLTRKVKPLYERKFIKPIQVVGFCLTIGMAMAYYTSNFVYIYNSGKKKLVCGTTIDV